jgi:hypothetical protein
MKTPANLAKTKNPCRAAQIIRFGKIKGLARIAWRTSHHVFFLLFCSSSNTRDISSTSAHSNTNMSCLDCRCIIYAIAGHGDDLTVCLQALDNTKEVFG